MPDNTIHENIFEPDPPPPSPPGVQLAETPVHRAPEPELIDNRPGAPRPLPPFRRRTRLALILFLATCVSTFLVGAYGVGVFPLPVYVIVLFNMTGPQFVQWLTNGLTYSTGVMSILLAHEMGHYLQAHRYGVPASFPYFIPFPISPIGTMGAVIVQHPGYANRKSLFDIAISGPLAGLCVAIPMVCWGLTKTQIVDIPSGGGGYTDPLLIRWIAARIVGPLGPNQDYLLNPQLFAGWVGIFITGLNLIPIGQLDGGHILYTLILKKARVFTKWLFRVAVVSVILAGSFVDGSYFGWTIMLLLLSMMGAQHPPTADDTVPLGLPRILLGWVTLAFIFVGFTPLPMYTNSPEEKPTPAPRASPDDLIVRHFHASRTQSRPD